LNTLPLSGKIHGFRGKKMKKHLFCGSIIAFAVFFAACSADGDDVSAEAEILDPGPRYSISVIPEKDEAGGVIIVDNAGGIVTTSPSGMVKAGTTVTLSAHPERIAAAEDAGTSNVEDGEQVYWFVKSITGSYSLNGGPERTNVSFRPSSIADSNEWTFGMTPGNLVITVEFTTEADKTTAFLSSLYASDGVISPNFDKNTFDYTIAVPFDAEEFSISAQAENPYLEPELQRGNPGSGYDLSGQPLTLAEGLNEHTITVISQDKATTHQYHIKVIKLPDLSLKTFQITKADTDYEQDLPPMDTQTVYIPYPAWFDIKAVPCDPAAQVEIAPPPATITIKHDVPTTVTVTVSKDVPGVSPAPQAEYKLDLLYAENMDLEPLADGGYISFRPSEPPGFFYEVHTFRADNTAPGGQAAAELVFKTETRPATVEALVVAGGGAGGMSGGSWRAGGGGAGGYIYVPSYTINADSIAVKVGAGGDKVSSTGSGMGEATIAGKGADSVFGGITAYGGGGGASHNGGTYNNGQAGGSGGGASAWGKGGNTNPGTAPAGAVRLGNAGGGAGNNNPDKSESGSGGGGAGGPGASVTGQRQGALGGVGTISVISGQAQWYAGGGAGGAENRTSSNPPLEAYGATAGNDGAAGTGDGGSGGGGVSNKLSGGAGGSGIVIISFPHPGN
jgi:hypothetical protein